MKKHIKMQRVTGNKKAYLELLLIADEQEEMIDKYLERGEMFIAMENGKVIAECVVTYEDEGIYELKNIAVLNEYRRCGNARHMIEYLFDILPDCLVMYVGTGDCPSSLLFYQKCGFKESHRVKNFFTDNYDHEMFEDGKQLIDMIYLRRDR